MAITRVYAFFVNKGFIVGHIQSVASNKTSDRVPHSSTMRCYLSGPLLVQLLNRISHFQKTISMTIEFEQQVQVFVFPSMRSIFPFFLLRCGKVVEK